MRLIVGFLALAIAVAPAAARAIDRDIRAGDWSLEAPFELAPLPGSWGTLFRQEVEGPFHTIVLRVAGAWTVPWTPAERGLPPKERLVALVFRLVFGVDERRLAVEATPLAPDSRFSRVEVGDMPEDVLPETSVCGGYTWDFDDVGVPGHEGQVHRLRGYSLYCLDFVDAADKFHVLEISFSERYCAGMGHEPYKGFEDLAGRIFKSIRFRAGPPHAPLSETPGDGARVASAAPIGPVRDLLDGLPEGAGCRS